LSSESDFQHYTVVRWFYPTSSKRCVYLCVCKGACLHACQWVCMTVSVCLAPSEDMYKPLFQCHRSWGWGCF